MAVDILRDPGHSSLFGQRPLEPWDTMPEDFQTPSHPYYETLVDQTEGQHPFYVEGAHGGVGEGMPPPAEAGSASKKRKASRPKFPTELRRPASTPQIRGANQPDQSSPLESPNSEKRRNKLGYHRTSVACGHCRRRKIRCLLSNDDTQGRCLNCIRLKKDCHFYPVDQAPGDPKSHASGGSAEGSAKQQSASAHSSPRTSAASDSVDDGAKAQGQLAQGPFSMHSSKQGSELEYAESPIESATFQSPTFSYQGMSETTPQWGQPAFYGSQALPEDPNTPHSSVDFWSQQHAPHPAAIYQHRGSGAVGLEHQQQQQQQTPLYVPGATAAAAHHPWAGMRSMSMGDASQVPQHFHHTPYRPQQGFVPGPYPYPYPPVSGPAAVPATFGGQQQPPGAHEVPMVPPVPHVVPSQSFPPGWSAFSAADSTTPGAEQGQAMFGAPWFGEGGLDEAGHPQSDPRFHPASRPG